jgi:hypothetical protein
MNRSRTLKGFLLIFAIGIGVGGFAQPTSAPEFTLPSDYKQEIREYISEKQGMTFPLRPAPFVTFFTPDIAKIVHGDSSLEKNKSMRAVLVHWTPRAPDGSPYLMIAEGVFLFKNARMAGIIGARDIEWLDGPPKEEK